MIDRKPPRAPLAATLRAREIFAACAQDALREACNGDPTDLVVARLPWADAYAATGRVPARAAIEHGWRFACSGCGLTLDRDYFNDRPRLSPQRVVGAMPGMIFCCARCERAWRARESDRAAACAGAIEAARAWLAARYPEARIGRARADTVGHRSRRAWNIEFLEIEFGGPGSAPALARLVLRRDAPSFIGPPAPSILFAGAGNAAARAR